MIDLGAIRLFLFDIDGVFLAGKDQPRLLSGWCIVPALRERQLPFRLVTNTSTHPREHIANSLVRLGVPVGAEEILSAVETTVSVGGQEDQRGLRSVGAVENVSLRNTSADRPCSRQSWGFARTYDEVRRAVMFARWHEDDADEFAPSLYAGRYSRRSAKSDAQSPAAEPPAEPAPASPAPAAPEAATSPVVPGGGPFVA